MSKVLAKFVMTGLESQRNAQYERNAETGKYEPVSGTEACVVKFNGVQGEPFGKYTPNANAQMTILNPAAAAIFREAWEAYVKSSEPSAKAPEFYVTFKLDTDEGAD